MADAGRSDGGASDAGRADAGTPDAGRTGPSVTVTPGRLDYRDGSVQLDSAFGVSFDDAMDAGTVVVAFTPSIATQPIEWLADSPMEALVRPASDLQAGTTYTLTNTGSAQSGALIDPPFEQTFHTQAVPDRTPPSIVSTTPAHNATNVDPSTEFSVTFSEPMLEVSVSPAEGELGAPTVTDSVTYTYEPPDGGWSPGATHVVGVNGNDLCANAVGGVVSFSVACLTPGTACRQDSECCLGSCVDGGCP